MAQADGVVANGTGSAVRSDINNQYAALWSNHSGSTEPSSGKVAYQFWADTNTSILKIRNSANNAWINLFTLAGGIDVDAASNFNEDVTFTGASYNLVWDKSDNALEFADNSKAKFGDDNDLVIYNTGSESQITNTSSWLKVFTDSLRIKDKDDADNHIVANHDGSVELYFNGSKKFETYAGGCQMGGDLSFYDSQVANFGTGSDLQIYHNGTDSYLINTTGSFIFRNDGEFKWQKNNGSFVGYIDPDGETRVYHNASQKIVTTSSGCTVYGTVNETSDIALKENIKPLSNSLANLKQLNGYSYKFKDTEKVTGVKSLGLTAQEVEKVYPELVEGEEGQKTLQYSGLIAPLLEAIKELNTKIETLETKVAALEAK